MNEKHKILVVDDDAFIRKPLEFILQKEGFDAATAVDGNDCLSQIEQDQPSLIILDVMMPGRDGFDVCKTIKQQERFAEIPIILLSARGQEHDRERGLCLGAADFMTKPYSPAELLRRVREILSEN